MQQHSTTKKRAVPHSSENVKTQVSVPTERQALSLPHKLQRTTFNTCREMDFFSERELVTQTGHSREEWPLVVVKELCDNALDACEEANIPPVLLISADATGITVGDNGAGIPEATLQSAMDFSVRSSNREAYVAPDRGAQGNALKTLLAMPRVLDPNAGQFIVTAHGTRHVISCSADPISQRAVISDDHSKCKNPSSRAGTKKQAFTSGTTIRLEWSDQGVMEVDGGGQRPRWPFADNASNKLHEEKFRRLVEGFSLFNPHAAISLDWFGSKSTWPATDPGWQKWKPCQPTSAHWYELRHLERSIAAYITHDRESGKDRLVSDFVAEFDGLSGSQKRSKVLDETDLRRVNLSAFDLGGKLDSERLAALLQAMQRHTRPVNPTRLGLIGEEHLKLRLLAMGVKPESFRYCKKLSKCKKPDSATSDKARFLDDVPWVLESAFGWLENHQGSRRIYSGANFSAAITNPFRSFGSTGEGLETALADMRAGRHEPIVLVLHLAHPRVEYTDRGKSALVIGGAA